MTVPVALLSPMAKILGATKLRTGALTRRAGALSLRNAVLPSSEAAGLKFRRVFMWVMQTRVDVLTSLSARDIRGRLVHIYNPQKTLRLGSRGHDRLAVQGRFQGVGAQHDGDHDEDALVRIVARHVIVNLEPCRTRKGSLEAMASKIKNTSRL